MAQYGSDELSMILVMGLTGSGKSHFINQLAGRTVVEEGASLKSCTQKCAMVPVEIGKSKSKVLMIDTPGFDDTDRPDAEILNEISQILSAQYKLGTQLKGVVYLHRISDVKMGGSSNKTLQVFQKICGRDALKNVLLVTSRWSELNDPSRGASRENELRDDFWAYMLGHGAKMSRFHGDRPSAISLAAQLLQNDGVVLELQRELVDDGKLLRETSAGAFVADELEKFRAELQAELEGLEKLKLELRETDRAMKARNKKDVEREQAKLSKSQAQQETLQAPVGAQVERLIKQKKSGSKSKFLLQMGKGILPLIIEVIAMIIGIPPSTFGLFLEWFPDLTSAFFDQF